MSGSRGPAVMSQTWRQRLRKRLRREAGEPVSDVWLVVGLGNPGPSYSANRHNIGHRVIDELATRMGAVFRPHKSGRADVVEGRLGGLGGVGGVRAVLARPRCYMNESGGPVSTLANFYKIPVDHIVAVHDELDLPFDTLRVKFGGGDNGHNGLRSMRRSLDSGEFYRVRLGVGRPPGRMSPADFVLSNYTAKEAKMVSFQVDRAADAVESLLVEGLVKTQARFNG